MTGISKAERAERKKFLLKMLEQGFTLNHIVSEYDKKFETHYYPHIFPLMGRKLKP